MSHISTHILNTATGEPAIGLNIDLYFQKGFEWDLVANGTTNNDGRISHLYEPEKGIHDHMNDALGYLIDYIKTKLSKIFFKKKY